MSARLRTARFDDYHQIARLEREFNAEVSPEEGWRHLWQGSPLWPKLEEVWPIGWVLEAENGKIVGSLGNIPLEYHFQGEPLVAATGRGWVVAPEYRGFALWLLSERFNQPHVDLFVDTTISSNALDAFDELSFRVPAGDWETVSYYVTRHRDFADRALRKLNVPFAPVLAPFAGAALRLKEVVLDKHLPKTAASVTVEETNEFDSRFDAFWRELLRQNPNTLLAARDRATLTWHFAGAMRRRSALILTASLNKLLIGYAVFSRLATANHLRMRLVDYQSLVPELDVLGGFLAMALRLCVAENASVLDRPGVGLPKMRVFDEYAPYRAKQTWPFFYRAADPGLADRLRQSKHWNPSAYDGDASIE